MVMINHRSILVFLLLVGGLCALLIPDWFEDPIALALGRWQAVPSGMRAEVDEERVRWQVGGHYGRFAYEWVQTRDEPYRVIFRRGEQVFEADVIFDGEDEVVVLPLVFDELPPMAREYIASQNKARNRPEKELRFVFRREKEK